MEVLEYRTLLSGPPTSIPQHYSWIRIAETGGRSLYIFGSYENQLLTNSVDLVPITDIIRRMSTPSSTEYTQYDLHQRLK